MARSLVATALNLMARDTTTPVPFARRSVHIPWTDRADDVSQMRAFGSEPTLFACVTRLAVATASVDWHLYQRARSGQDEDRVEVVDHPALDLWNNPNPHYTRAMFVETIEQHLDLTGDTYWVIGSNDPTSARLPGSIWPVRPDRMEPVQDPRRFITGYIYTSPDGERIPLGVDDVIHIYTPDPMDPYHGLGPVRSLLVDLDASRFASEWNRNFFMNSAQPGGIIEVEANLTDSQFDELAARWAEQHRGVSAAHRVAILEAGMRWVDRSFSRRDMEFTSLQKVSDERIMLAFGMSKVLLGQTESVNRSTAEAAEYIFGRYQLVPRLDRIRQAVNRHILPRFPSGAGLEFDYDSPVSGNVEVEARERDSKVKAALDLIAAGFDPASVMRHLDLHGLELAVEAAQLTTSTSTALTPVEMAELIQKIYLGVGPVVTWSEARAVLHLGGVPVDLSLPAPTAAPPADDDSGGEPGEPGDDDGGEHGDGPGDDELRVDGVGEVTDTATVAGAVARALAGTPHGHGSAHRRNAWGWSVRPRNAEDPPDLDPDDLPDVTRLQESFESIMDDLMAEWEGIEGDQKAALVAQVSAVAEGGTLADLDGLVVDLKPATAVLAAAMIRAGDEAAGALVDEAAEQGVTIEPREADEGRVLEVAAVVAGLVAGRLIGGAKASALRADAPGVDAATVVDRVRDHLDGLSKDGPRPQLGGSLTGTQNEARLETLRRATSGAVYSAEINDAAICDACKAIDGKWLGNAPEDLDEVIKLYPGGAYGGYVDCYGRERCRGTITGVWRRSSR